MGGLPPEAWRPVSFFQWIPTSVLTDVSTARGLAIVYLVLLAAGLLGIATRGSLALAAIVSLYVLGLPQNQVKVAQNGHVVWFLALLAAGPSGRMLSVDGLVRAVRSAREGRAEPRVASALALPTLRWVWCLFGLIYFAPGLAKLHAAISDGWTDAGFVRSILHHQGLELTHYETGPAPPVASVVALPSWCLTTGAWLVIAFEVGFGAAVLIRPLRPFAAVAGLAFHAVNGAVLRIRFAMLVPAYVALVDWAALARGVRRVFGIARVPLWTSQGSTRRRVASAALRSVDVLDVFEAQGTDEAAPERGRIALRILGIALVAGQLIWSVSRVAAIRSDGPDPAVRASGRWGRQRWPFDAYPDFTRRRTIAEVREIRVALRDGREVTLGPSAFARTYGSAANTSWLFEYALLETCADGRRPRIVPLVRAVVEHAPPEVRAIAVQASLHTIRWRVDGLSPVRLDERLEERVPLMPR
jgi:hypothetical protein